MMRLKSQPRLILLLALAGCQSFALADEPGLIGHWKLQGDCRDYSGRGNHGINRGVGFDGGGAAFDGVKSWI